MDPNVTFFDLMHTYSRELSYSLARDLQNWLNKGGFYPQGYSKGFVDKIINQGLKCCKQNSGRDICDW